MKTYSKKGNETSRTLDAVNTTSNQKSLSEILSTNKFSSLQRKTTANYLPSVSAGLERHHIIPDSTLKNFIAKIRGTDLYCSLLQAVEAAYMKELELSQGDIDLVRSMGKVTDAKKNVRFEQYLPHVQRFLLVVAFEKVDDIDMYNGSMEDAFIWSPGNLVVGPTHQEGPGKYRNDDPGAAFDSEAAYIADIGADEVTALENVDGIIFQVAQGIRVLTPVEKQLIESTLLPHIVRGISDRSTSTEWLTVIQS